MPTVVRRVVAAQSTRRPAKPASAHTNRHLDEPGGSAWQGPHPADAMPPQTPSYIWNVASTEPTSREQGDRRYVFSGLTDTAFDAIPLIEAADRGEWPF